jgi:hypothetical protein
VCPTPHLNAAAHVCGFLGVFLRRYLAGVTTTVGAPNPGAWVAVTDEASGGLYYWNQQSGGWTGSREWLGQGRTEAVKVRSFF